MDTFQSCSSSQKNKRTVVITFVCLFALSLFAWKVTVALWIFTLVVLSVAMGFCWFLTGNTWWQLAFSGTELELTNHGNKQSYTFQHLIRGDFLITQSEKQKRKDTCDLRIRGVSIRMDDVERCTELQRYIQQHYH